MAAQFVTGPERPLQVDAPAGLPCAERGAAERLVGDIDGKDAALSGRVDLDSSQARTVAGDRGADSDAGSLIAAADRKPPPAALQELADIGDDPGEHETSITQLSSRPERESAESRDPGSTTPSTACWAPVFRSREIPA